MMTVNTMIAGLNNIADDVKFVGANVDNFDCVHVGGVTNVIVNGNVVNIVFEQVGDNTLTDFDACEGENWSWLDEDNEKVINFVNENGRSHYIWDDEELDEEVDEDEDELDVQNNVMDLNLHVWEQKVINNVYGDNKFLTVKEVINKLNIVDGDFEVVFDYFGEKIENINFEVVNDFKNKDFDFDFVSGDEELNKLAKNEFKCKDFVLC